MIIEYKKEDKLLFIKITEEIDHHQADKIRRNVDNEIERYMPRKVVFDFSQVLFMDSAGIGMILRKIQINEDIRRKCRNDKCFSWFNKNF